MSRRQTCLIVVEVVVILTLSLALAVLWQAFERCSSHLTELAVELRAPIEAIDK